MSAQRRRQGHPGHRVSFGEQVVATVRQRRFPRALRIGSVDPPLGLDALVEALAASPGRNGQDQRYQGDPPDDRDAAAAQGKEDDAVLDDRAVASLATGLWRARRRMLAPGTDEPRTELRPVFRHLQSTWDTLAAAGVVIQDHDGQRFESGLALEVLTFQPTPGLAREAVVETVRPSVYVGDRVVQLGQVIVGTPGQAQEQAPEGEGDRR